MATDAHYSPLREAERIFEHLCSMGSSLQLPPVIEKIKGNVKFTSEHDRVYFPIPFKETETAAALKALEGSLALALHEQKNLRPEANGDRGRDSIIRVSLESATSFLFQAYRSKIDGLGKLDAGARAKLVKDTDLLAAQSDPYRRLAANLYRTADPGRYYHIHGSLEASTTLRMLGLPAARPDLVAAAAGASHEDMVRAIEARVCAHTVAQLEHLNSEHAQAGAPALARAEFADTPHGRTLAGLPPWTVRCLDDDDDGGDKGTSAPPPAPLPRYLSPTNKPRILDGIKVLELCRVIAGPTAGRILAEYGADVLKITSPALPDVPFFQVDGNMGKRCADLDLKTSAKDRATFETLLAEADVLIDGYRPGAIAKLGYGPERLAELGRARGKGYVYLAEDCFGFEGEWAGRAGWQQIADCVTGLAWEQGKFLGCGGEGGEEPVVPPFPISDYGTGCMGAIAALTGLWHRADSGGSWWGGVSLCQYDLLLMAQGEYGEVVQEELKGSLSDEVRALRYHSSVEQVSGAALRWMQKRYPWLFEEGKHTEKWKSEGYRAEIEVVKPVVEIEGVAIGFQRASRPNGTDSPSFDGL